jgi:hypothetical protein
VNESPPYGYTMKEWDVMKPGWEKRVGEVALEKRKKFREWQKKYIEANPEAAQKMADDNEPDNKGN